jgi:hypothetical protein
MQDLEARLGRGYLGLFDLPHYVGSDDGGKQAYDNQHGNKLDHRKTASNTFSSFSFGLHIGLLKTNVLA